MVVMSSLLMLSQDCFLGGSSSCSGSAGHTEAGICGQMRFRHSGANVRLAGARHQFPSSLHANCKQETHL